MLTHSAVCGLVCSLPCGSCTGPPAPNDLRASSLRPILDGLTLGFVPDCIYIRLPAQRKCASDTEKNLPPPSQKLDEFLDLARLWARDWPWFKIYTVRGLGSDYCHFERRCGSLRLLPAIEMTISRIFMRLHYNRWPLATHRFTHFSLSASLTLMARSVMVNGFCRKYTSSSSTPLLAITSAV